jgi:hypothetical protein
MKPVNPLWFKVLALGIAVGLGGGYVWKRQQSAATPPPSVEVKAQEAQENPPALLLSGSKSAAVNLVESPTVVIEPSQRLMPSSKVGILVEPEKETQPEPQQPKQP